MCLARQASCERQESLLNHEVSPAERAGALSQNRNGGMHAATPAFLFRPCLDRGSGSGESLPERHTDGQRQIRLLHPEAMHSLASDAGREFRPGNTERGREEGAGGERGERRRHEPKWKLGQAGTPDLFRPPPPRSAEVEFFRSGRPPT